ncbi:helix-turn-helix transcriptional regulator [Solwaraspora sp. WMMD1047]|uniref:helix-turn-helix domain-containing protein n=1 Tax=Solwaraspora sp. WMMD1047 TaxID=3016102 RepID=UPI002415E064|nr:helix-turn-helix transcriptional regulator [Solwaraspora sp. WMMD1047]MDG4833927.1 helix-turn-helix transcriptional regulator [Solwaraspora sp. WMMD1047]
MAARRRLGRLLSELRVAKGITQDVAAEFIERVPSTLYRMEAGKPGVRIRIKQDILGLCELYEADSATRDGLVKLAEATRVKGWYQPYNDLLVPTNFDSYIGLEQDSTELDTFETQLVPGLLQTERYARALVTVPDSRDRSAEEIDRRVELRLRRQQILSRPDPVRLNVVVSEAAIRQSVGGQSVMAEQLQHLADSSEWPNVTLRVLPLGVGVHDGLVSGNFVILRFSAGHEPPMVYSDVLLGGLWFEEAREIARFLRAFTDISDHALDVRRSRDLIRKTARELAQDG